MLPKYYPPKSTVYHYFKKWSESLHFDEMLRKLVSMKRAAMGRNPEPDGAVIDSQSVRLGLDDSVAGIDGGKKVKGIKRHIAVDSNGFPLQVQLRREISLTGFCQLWRERLVVPVRAIERLDAGEVTIASVLAGEFCMLHQSRCYGIAPSSACKIPSAITALTLKIFYGMGSK